MIPVRDRDRLVNALVKKMSTIENSGVDGNGLAIPGSASSLASNSMDGVASDSSQRIGQAGEPLLGKLLRGPTPGKRFSYFLLIPAMFALAISCYLSYTTFTSSPIAGCGDGGIFDCSSVQKSKYSKWLGIPVSALAAVNYLGMVIGLSLVTFTQASRITQRISWSIIGFAGLSAGLAALWFVGLQIFVLGKYCHWCMIAHGCGLTIATAILVRRPVTGKMMLAGAGLAVVSMAGLITGQVTAEEEKTYRILKVTPSTHTGAPADEVEEFFAPPMGEDGNLFETSRPDDVSVPKKTGGAVSASLLGLFAPTAMVSYTPQEETRQEDVKEEAATEAATPKDTSQQESTTEEKVQEEKPERRFVKMQGNLKLDPRQWPLLGSPEAEFIFVEMFDYNCPHCRDTHRAIKGACEAMGKDLAIIVLPVPLNSNCNSGVTQTGANFVQSCEISKLAVACWRLDPAKFEEFHHWMFEGNAAPNYETAKAKVYEMIGRERVDTELTKEAPGKYITRHVQLYGRAGHGIVPKLLFPTTTVEGAYTDANSLVNLIKENAK